jgi:hypothetical protein
MAKTLTAAAVARLRPGKERIEVRDGGAPGLHLIIQASGVKSWAVRYRRPGTRKNVKLTLGRADVTSRDPVAEPAVGGFLTLAEARVLAARMNHEQALGRDPAAAKRRDLLARGARQGDVRRRGDRLRRAAREAAHAGVARHRAPPRPAAGRGRRP